VADFIYQHFLPVTFNIKQTPAMFHRFDVLWTPTILVLDSDAVERYRIEGYLPKDEFSAQLEMSLGRVAFTHKQWAEAEDHYTDAVEKWPGSISGAEAMYWAAVSHYKKTNDHTVLAALAEQLQKRYPQNLWTKRAWAWMPSDVQAKSA
jgi:Tetratricopeptide repeat